MIGKTLGAPSKLKQPDVTIAIVDDDLAIRNALKEYLATFGYKSRLFVSAEEFLAFQGSASFDCILSDIKMPGMSGLEMQEVLLGYPSPSPIIFMTSYDYDDAMRDLAIGRGAVAFLGKPVATRKLAEHIATVLRNRLE